jgi:hypothetical protein
MSPPRREPVESLVRADAPTRHGIIIERIHQQRRGGEIIDRERPACARRLAPRQRRLSGRARRAILRQPPAGVKGRAVAAHGQPAQQSLETELAGHRPHLVRRVEKRMRRRRRIADHEPRVAQRRVEIASRPSRHRVGMRAQHDASLRLGQRVLQHPLKTAGVSQGAGHGIISGDLIDEQEIAAPVARQPDRTVGQMIVFRQPLGDDPRRERARFGLQRRRLVAAQQRLQPGGARGVVIDAEIVDDERHRRRAGLAESDRAQKTVLQRPERPSELARDRRREPGRLFAAPAGEPVGARHGQAQRPDPPRRQHRRKFGKTQQGRFRQRQQSAARGKPLAIEGQKRHPHLRRGAASARKVRTQRVATFEIVAPAPTMPTLAPINWKNLSASRDDAFET